MRRRERAVAVLVAAALAGCRGRDGGGDEAPAPARRTVRCAAAERAEVADTIELRGTVAALPDRDAQIAPQVAGRILRLLVREGDRVSAGQPIARIDDALLVEESREAVAALAKTRAEVTSAETTLARTRRVFEHGIAPRQEVEDMTARAAAAQANESQAVAAAARARRQVERATVRSALDGVVVRILRRSGELVDGTPATPVVEVADPRQLELVADAPASDLVRLQPGLRADVEIAALPGRTWAGVVAAVSPAVDRATGLGTVRVALDLGAAAESRPPIGVLGSAGIRVGRARQATLVPRESLRSAVGAADAEVVVCGAAAGATPGVAHVVKVRRGVARGTKVEAFGLAPGQRVAVEPVMGIADGEPIEEAAAK